MIGTFLLFGIAIGAFQGFILKEIWGIKSKLVWLTILFTPTLILSTYQFSDDQMSAVALFGCMSSIFILAIIGSIYNSVNVKSSNYNKSYNEIVKDYKQPIYFNPFWGIIYQLYIVVMILVYIFVPENVFNSTKSYEIITQDLMLQIVSLFIFTGFSIIILLYNHLNKILYYIPSLFSTKRLVSTTKDKLINRIIIISITVISFIIFLKFCYDKGFYNQLKTIFENYNSSTIFSINSAIIVFIIFNSIILIINPSKIAKRNMLRIVQLIHSAFLSIFISAAIGIPLMILQDKISMNMSSEILLFLGFNIVLLVNEISLFIKYRKGELD